jgi:hypothetical protein
LVKADVVFNSSHTFSSSYMAICAIIKEEYDLFEWVEYHWKMGVGKFYIVDNGDMTGSKKQLQQFIDSGVVVLTERHGPALQMVVYQSCIDNFKHLHQWIGFFDADEYVVTTNNCSIPSILRNFTEYGGVSLNWMAFGSSGHVFRPQGGVIANYNKCSKSSVVKVIGNMEYVVSHAGNPHQLRYSHGKGSVSPDLTADQRAHNELHSSLYNLMYLNHYHLKSKEDFDRAKGRGRADGQKPHRNDEWFSRVDRAQIHTCPILQMPSFFANDC